MLETLNIQYDVTTYVAALLCVIVLVVGIGLRPGAPAAHPFLLGRQSTIARTRFINESPVYTNGSTGGLRSPQRPDKRVRLLQDIVQGSLTSLDGGQRGTWIKGGEKLGEVVNALRAGLISKLGNGNESVAVVVENPTDALLVTLALALTSHKPVVVAPGSKLPEIEPVGAILCSSALSTASSAVPRLADAKSIVLDEDGSATAEAEELLALGRSLVANDEAPPPPPEVEPKDIALTMVSEGVALELTHVNLSTSIVSWLAMFPASPKQTRPAIKDHIVSFHHPSTPYGFGLALAIMYCSSSLSLPSLSKEPAPEELERLFLDKAMPLASIVFAPASLLSDVLYKLLLSKMLGDSAAIIKHTLNGKRRLLNHGVISQQSVYDNWLFAGVRKDTGLSRVRALILEGPMEQARSESFRVILGIPCLSTLEHPCLLAPVTAAMMYDFQRLPRPSATEVDPNEVGHVGPPIVGAEIKLRGKEEDMVKGRMRGEVLLRSPMLPSPATLPPSLLQTDESLPQLPPYPNAAPTPSDDSAGKWLRSGMVAEMSPEGTLWLELE